MSSCGSQADLEIARAEKAAEAAETLFQKELYEDSVARAYYAVLHAAMAALANKGVSPATH